MEHPNRILTANDLVDEFHVCTLNWFLFEQKLKKNDSMVIEGRLHFVLKQKVNNIQHPIWIVQWNIPIDATANNSVDINDNDIVDPTQSNYNCQWLGRFLFEQK